MRRFGLVGACVAQAAPASATALSPSTSDCSYSNAITPANSEAVLGVTPGSTITISCAAGSFTASSTLVVVEASGLAAIVSPSSAELSEVDLGTLGIASAGSDGSLSTTFTLPTTFSASDSNAACPTPATADSHCWWGAPVTGAPSTAFGGIPAPEALVNGRLLTGSLAVSPAIYCQTGATAAACASLPVGTLIPPALSGSVTTRNLSEFRPIVVNEPNATPYSGNGRLRSLIAGTRNVSAVLFRHRRR